VVDHSNVRQGSKENHDIYHILPLTITPYYHVLDPDQMPGTGIVSVSGLLHVADALDNAGYRIYVIKYWY
jgi:hypothetical protein